MDINKNYKKMIIWLKKYRYVALILAVGLALMLMPTFRPSVKTENNVQKVVEVNNSDISTQLEALLSQIEGAGQVRVMLTVKKGEEIIYQTDEDQTLSDSSSTMKSDTITVTDADRNQSGLIKQVNPPVYLGAIVLCQGADSPSIRLEIVDAVSKITGLGADKISVIKMK